VGQLLIEAKEQRAHGAWLPWLAKNCPDIPPRTAQGYMRIARGWAEIEKRGGVAHLSVRRALSPRGTAG
jgi:hypothetical protein